MSKILIIGANGYIGSYLKDNLPNSIGVGRNDFDFNNKEQIENFFEDKVFDTCIILSAQISFEKNIDFQKEPFLTNVNGLNNLLSVLDMKFPNIKVVYFSSMTVYGVDNILPANEDSDLLPLHSYGFSKVYAENLIKYYNFDSIVIRIPGIYGGNRKSGLVYNVIHKLKNNEEVKIDTKALGYWETLHIKDLYIMLIKFLDSYKFNKKFDIFNICYGEETDVIDMVYFLKDMLNSTSNIDIQKDYSTFYMSNQKILKLIDKPMTFKNRLKLYAKELV
jgi:nucleoside-diphosphate-sugar epimerase